MAYMVTKLIHVTPFVSSANHKCPAQKRGVEVLMKYKLIKPGHDVYETDNWRIADTMWAQGWKFYAPPIESLKIVTNSKLVKKDKSNGR